MSLTPVYVAGNLMANVYSISAGSKHTCTGVGLSALGGLNAANCWGDNEFGELGDGTTTSSSVPVNVLGTGEVAFGGNPVLQVTTGANQSCAVVVSSVAGEQVVWCWGSDNVGQLGDAYSGPQPPASVQTSPVTVGYSFTNELDKVSGGYDHTCALTWERLCSLLGR